MAAKKAPSKKKTTPKKSTKSTHTENNKVSVVVLLIAIVIVVVYGLVQLGQFAGEPPTKVEENEMEASPKNEPSLGNEKVESNKVNEKLPEYIDTDDYYFTNSFDFGWPAYTQEDQIVEHQYYSLSYNEKHEQANWIAYSLTSENLSSAQFKRKDNFKEDPLVTTQSATLADYKKSGFDRGHLAPAADFTWTENGLDESFFMSNMSPQAPSFNRGIWKKLEEQVRNWARKNDKLYIVTGPVLTKKLDHIGKNKVSIPEYYYKAILDIEEPEIKAIAFLMKNGKSSSELLTFSMSIDELEETTGLDFFPLLPDELEFNIERELNLDLWK